MRFLWFRKTSPCDFTRAYLEDPKMHEQWETDRPLYGRDFVNAINGATADSTSVAALRKVVS